MRSSRARRYADEGDVDSSWQQVLDLLGGVTNPAQQKLVVGLLTSAKFLNAGNGNGEQYADEGRDGLEPDAGENPTDPGTGLARPARSNYPEGKGPYVGERTTNYKDVVRKYSETFERFSDRQRSDVQRLVAYAERNRHDKHMTRGFGEGWADQFVKDGIALIEVGISADEMLTGRRP
jgi:hypothetical protein